MGEIVTTYKPQEKVRMNMLILVVTLMMMISMERYCYQHDDCRKLGPQRLGALTTLLMK